MQSHPIRPAQAKTLAFEFTKRKRWADLLVTELTEAIIFVLNSNCHILYCGAAVNELLGWRDEELVDGDFIELVNVDDKTNFRNGFMECIRMRRDMLSYARLYCKNDYITQPDYSVRPKELLFEITGYPHFIEGDNDCKCFFAMAKPYPSRNTTMLNTFLELKMENERLQHRLQELRMENMATSSPMPGHSTQILHYASGSSAAGSSLTIRASVINAGHVAPTLHCTSELAEALYVVQDVTPNSVTRNFDTAGFRNADDDCTAEPAKKKKKLFASEQHVCVTCGRTDSPEWRKVGGYNNVSSSPDSINGFLRSIRGHLDQKLCVTHAGCGGQKRCANLRTTGTVTASISPLTPNTQRQKEHL